jgi:hypothetical protein
VDDRIGDSWLYICPFTTRSFPTGAVQLLAVFTVSPKISKAKRFNPKTHPTTGPTCNRASTCAMSAKPQAMQVTASSISLAACSGVWQGSNGPAIRTTSAIVFSLLFLIWTVTFVFIGVEWEAERESRLRFLSANLLSLMQVRSQKRKETIVTTLKSFCFTGEQLHQFLDGHPIREAAHECAILITTIHDYPLWRQQTTVTMALNCLDQYFRCLDKLRRSFTGGKPFSRRVSVSVSLCCSS